MLEMGNKEFYEPEEPGHHAYWVATGVLAASIGGLCWLGYPALRQAPVMLAQVTGFELAMKRVNAQLAAAEASIGSWGRSQQELQERVARIDQDMTSRFQAIRKQLKGVKTEALQLVHREVAAQTKELESKLASAELASAADRSHLDKLVTEVAALRQESDRQAAELSQARAEIERGNAKYSQQLASLNERAPGREAGSTEEPSRKLSVKRIDFEVTRDHSQQLAPGVSLDITSTDISHGRVSGWMWLMPDRRTIWLRGQGAQEPVAFYGSHDGKRRELVITKVTKYSATGYLLLPSDTGSNVVASVAKGD